MFRGESGRHTFGLIGKPTGPAEVKVFSRTLHSLRRRWRLSVIVLSVVLALLASYLVGIKVIPGVSVPAAPPGTAVPVHAVVGQRVKVPQMKPSRRQAASWPAGRTATVALAAPTGTGPGRGLAA